MPSLEALREADNEFVRRRQNQVTILNEEGGIQGVEVEENVANNGTEAQLVSVMRYSNRVSTSKPDTNKGHVYANAVNDTEAQLSSPKPFTHKESRPKPEDKIGRAHV